MGNIGIILRETRQKLRSQFLTSRFLTLKIMKDKEKMKDKDKKKLDRRSSGGCRDNFFLSLVLVVVQEIPSHTNIPIIRDRE